MKKYTRISVERALEIGLNLNLTEEEFGKFASVLQLYRGKKLLYVTDIIDRGGWNAYTECGKMLNNKGDVLFSNSNLSLYNGGLILGVNKKYIVDIFDIDNKFGYVRVTYIRNKNSMPNSINEILRNGRERILSHINNIVGTLNEQDKDIEYDEYSSKNVFWLMTALNKIDDMNAFKYICSYNTDLTDYRIAESIDSVNELDYYYDLIAVEFEDNWYAIPEPILCDILDVRGEILYLSFGEHTFRNIQKFI